MVLQTAVPVADASSACGKATITTGEQASRVVMDEESMLDLLQNIETGEPKRDAVRLVLAMLLLRRRALVQEGLGENGKLRFRPRGNAQAARGTGADRGCRCGAG